MYNPVAVLDHPVWKDWLEMPTGAGKNVIGARIRALRDEAHLTQTELAQQIGMDRAHLSSLENGRSDNPQIQTVFALAKALHTTPTYLLGLENEAGLVVTGWEDLPDILRDVLQTASRLTPQRQVELRYIARALAAAESDQAGRLEADLQMQKDLLRALHRVGGDDALRTFLRLVGMDDDPELLRIRLGM